MKVNIHVAGDGFRPGRLPYLIYLLLIAVVYVLLIGLPSDGRTEAASAGDDAAGTHRRLPPLRETSITIESGRSLSDILGEHGFSAADIHRLREDVKPVYDLARIKAGHELVLRSFDDGTPVTIQYGIDSESYLIIFHEEEGFRAEIRPLPIEFRTALVSGRIDSMLIAAVHQAGERDQLAIDLADLFAWDIDFYADMRPGDTFRVLVEKKYLEDRFIGYGRILAAEFTNQGTAYEAFRFAYPDSGTWDYFTFAGQSLRKEFLKSPINGARITSRFSHSRLHPVRKVYRAHYGVDYGASVGTPVQATADGTVTFAGRSGASGRMIRIRHKNAYETMYLHLSRYGRGVRRGAKVTGGQVIGYVGASGEVSGPHLDYRIRYHGNYVNPLAHKFKPVAPLREEYLGPFQEKAFALRLALDAPLLIFSSFNPGSLQTPAAHIGDGD